MFAQLDAAPSATRRWRRREFRLARSRSVGPSPRSLALYASRRQALRWPREPMQYESLFQLQKNEPKRLKSLSRGENCILLGIVNCRAISLGRFAQDSLLRTPSLYRLKPSPRSRWDERAAKVAAARVTRQGGGEDRRGDRGIVPSQRSPGLHADVCRRAGPSKASRARQAAATRLTGGVAPLLRSMPSPG